MLTAYSLLKTLRAKGYSLQAAGDCLEIEGPEPVNPSTSLRWLTGHKVQLLAVLSAEADPAVARALQVFPTGRVLQIRLAGEPFSAVLPVLTATNGQPTSWRDAGAFKRHLDEIGGRLYRDPVGLVCIAPEAHFTVSLAAALRLWRKELLAGAHPDNGSQLEADGERWLRV